MRNNYGSMRGTAVLADEARLGAEFPGILPLQCSPPVVVRTHPRLDASRVCSVTVKAFGEKLRTSSHFSLPDTAAASLEQLGVFFYELTPAKSKLNKGERCLPSVNEGPKRQQVLTSERME